MAEAGFSLRSATAEGTTGTVISALGQKNGLWTVWVTGASAVVELLYRGHLDAPWVPIAAITAGSEGGAACGGGDAVHTLESVRALVCEEPRSG